MKNKLINVLYRGGGGGEFLGGQLVKHKEIVTKKVEHIEEIEKWQIERDDQLSQYHMDGSSPYTDWSPDPELWNIRLDHGYGFSKQPQVWTEYLWESWFQTKSILLQPKSEESVKYIDELAKAKLDLGNHNKDGHLLMKHGMDLKRFWTEQWQTCQELTQMYQSMIPVGHDYIIIDPCDLFHRDETRTEVMLDTLIEYLDIDDYLFDEWKNSIEKYRVKNRSLINRTIV